MVSPRWRKVLRDLWGSKVRTLLVVTSIAVGVFSVGMIAGTHVLLSRELTRAYLAINPASAILYTGGFGEELVRAVRKMPGVKEAEGRRALSVRVQVAADDWRRLVLFVVSDYDDIRINQIRPQDGKWGPSAREVLLERASLSTLRARIGDTIRVETPEGRLRELRVVGTAHDLNQFPTPLSGTAYGYITFDTLEWLGWQRAFNELHIVVDGAPEEARDVAYIRRVAQAVAKRVEKSGRPVSWTWIPTPGKHPADDVIQPLLIILGFLGVLTLVMSGFLVVNTMAAIMTQQVRQIGVMKAIGARTHQLLGMYLGMVAALGVAALALAVPLAGLASRAVTAYMASLVNFDVVNFDPGPGVVLLQVAVGLCVPLLASLYPTWVGTRRTVREAISDHGTRSVPSRQSALYQWAARIPGISRPLLLSLANTFRRRGRLAMTLVTLTLGGAIFISVMSVQKALFLTLDDALRYWKYDIAASFRRAHRIERIERVALTVPGVVAAESWGFATVRVQRPDGSESPNYQMIAPPGGSRMIEPDVIWGRWLVPEDESAVVITSDVLKEEPHLRVGDELTLKIGERESRWRIVGVVRSPHTGPALWTNYDYFSRVTRSVGRATNVRVVVDSDDPARLGRVAALLKERLEAAGMQVSGTETIAQVREPIVLQFNILIAFLLIMATLLAVVGALGLAGTMSINVLERTREIGVMRAIGASNRSIMQLVIVEGLVIGAISWVLGGLLAVPLSQLLSDAVGIAFTQAPLVRAFSPFGVVLWLGIVLFLAAIASLIPAWNAARLTVRDVLAYE